MTEAEAGAITRIGFVGLGNMGWPMAHLLDAHFTLTVLDARAEVADSFAAEHRASATTSLEALAEASDAVITMLPNGDIVREVALGGTDGGDLVAGMAEGLGLEAPILARTRDLWRDAEELLGGAAGTSEVVKLWEEWNGRELGSGPD